MSKPERYLWVEGSTHRSVDGDCYDKVWDYAERLEAENEKLKMGVQDIRGISGTEWGRCEKDSPWGKTLFWIMQKCDTLLKE